MAAYCTQADLLTGSIPASSYIDVDRYIQSAADEIDSALAMRYIVPVVVPAIPQYAATTLVLKGINQRLASGRIITAAAATGSQTETHAYGLYLIEQALQQLKALIDGSYILPGAPTVNQPGSDTVPVLITNVDSESQVEAFYQRVTGYPPLPGGDVPWAAYWRVPE